MRGAIMDERATGEAARNDVELIAAAIAYVTELYRELSQENGAPTLGTQNQMVEIILADPALRDGVRHWAAGRTLDEASLEPPERLPHDHLYRSLREAMAKAMAAPAFTGSRSDSGWRG